MVVTISHEGYIKRNPVSLYRAQRRGGRGKIGATTRDEDFVEHLFVASTHSYILFFTTTGKVYWLKVHEIPQAGRAARGRAVTNLLSLKPEEKLSAFLPVREFREGGYLVFATRRGLIKKTDLMQYSSPRPSGIIAIALEEGDEVIGVRLTDGEPRGHPLDARRPGHPLRRSGGPADGSGHLRRPRHVPRRGRRAGGHRPRRDRRDAARRLRERLRQALGDGRVPAHASRRQGHHHDEDHRQDRAGGRRSHGHRRGPGDARDQRRQGDPAARRRRSGSSAATPRGSA